MWSWGTENRQGGCGALCLSHLRLRAAKAVSTTRCRSSCSAPSPPRASLCCKASPATSLLLQNKKEQHRQVSVQSSVCISYRLLWGPSQKLQETARNPAVHRPARLFSATKQRRSENVNAGPVSVKEKAFGIMKIVCFMEEKYSKLVTKFPSNIYIVKQGYF